MAQPTPTDEVAALKAELAELREDIGRLQDGLKKLVTRSAGAAKAKGAEKLDEARAEVEALLDDMQARGRQQYDEVSRAVQERPLTSLLAAFGLGLLIARLLGRD